MLSLISLDLPMHLFNFFVMLYSMYHDGSVNDVYYYAHKYYESLLNCIFHCIVMFIII